MSFGVDEGPRTADDAMRNWRCRPNGSKDETAGWKSIDVRDENRWSCQRRDEGVLERQREQEEVYRRVVETDPRHR